MRCAVIDGAHARAAPQNDVRGESLGPLLGPCVSSGGPQSENVVRAAQTLTGCMLGTWLGHLCSSLCNAAACCVSAPLLPVKASKQPCVLMCATSSCSHH
jgi:hypothetical protein